MAGEAVAASGLAVQGHSRLFCGLGGLGRALRKRRKQRQEQGWPLWFPTLPQERCRETRQIEGKDGAPRIVCGRKAYAVRVGHQPVESES